MNLVGNFKFQENVQNNLNIGEFLKIYKKIGRDILFTPKNIV